jgi:omega-amidase
MGHLKIHGIQFDSLWENWEENCARIEQEIERCEAGKLIVLPEMSLTGFTMNGSKHPGFSHIDEFFRDQARKSGSHIIAGYGRREGNSYLNCAGLWAPDGTMESEYIKTYPFSHSGEDKIYRAGSGPRLIEVMGIKLALSICYDLRFPEHFRAVTADLHIIIANWPEKRINHWKTLTEARAIENQAYVFALNRKGIDGNQIYYSGDSRCIDPWGAIEEASGTHFDCIVDTDRIHEIQRKYPFLADKKTAG